MATRIANTTTPVVELEGVRVSGLRLVQLPSFAVPSGDTHGPGQTGMVSELQAVHPLTQRDALTDWVAGLAGGKLGEARSGAVLVLDFNGSLLRRAEFTDALLTSVELPELDARSRDAVQLRMGWVPATMRYSGKTGEKVNTPAGKRKLLLASSFRVKGLPFEGGTQCLRVQLPRLSAPPSSVDGFDPRAQAPLQVSEAQLEFGGAAARDAMLDWVLKQVESPTPNRETFTMEVELLEPNLKAVALTFRLNHCSLLSYAESAIEPSADTQPTSTLSLNARSVDLVFAAG